MIMRVWGKADEFDLEFRPVGKHWEVSVPPDLSDGQYAVIIYAIATNSELGMWTGILYMSGGVGCLKINNERFSIWLQPDRNIIETTLNRKTLILKEGCRRVRF